MARQEWEAAEMRQVATDLRRLADRVGGLEGKRIERFACELELRAAELEAGLRRASFIMPPAAH